MYNLVNPNDYLTSYNFARNADVVFSEVLSTVQFNEIKNSNLKINFENSGITSYKIKNFKITQGDIIFSNSAAIKPLFKYLKNIDSSYNLILVTHQADYSIVKSLYLNKPKSIYKWYAINVNHSAKDLIPIPLGIANNYSSKNLITSHFIAQKNISSSQKEKKLYINLVTSTNYRERDNLSDFFSNQDWVVLKNPDLTLDDYHKDLQKYQFVLCPWGNGYDTHRLWETLYSGSIPVVKYHHTYSNLKGLPVIFYDNIEELSQEFLNDKFVNLDFSSLEKLNTKYWFDIIKSDQKKGDQSININEKKLYEQYVSISGKMRNRFLSYKKKVLFFKKQLFKVVTKI